MKILWLLSLISLFAIGLGETTISTKEPTLPDTTSTSTEPSTTTISTTTTEKSTTAAPTTTEATTVLPVNTTTDATSTEVPVTTHASASSTKAPEPQECKWNITQRDVTCIRAELNISFTVPIGDKVYPIKLACNASSDLSDCSSNDTQTLVLYEAHYYKFTMVFQRDSDKFYVKDMELEYNLPTGEGVVATNSTKIFSVKTGNSYLCKSKSTINLGNVTMEISEIHVQAFLQKGDKDFGSVEECDADDKVSDVVPIAVGVALAALIMIVLIAYLVGRRRSRQKGYQSV